MGTEKKKKEAEKNKYPYALCPRCITFWDVYTCEEVEGDAVLPCGHRIRAPLYTLIVFLYNEW